MDVQAPSEATCFFFNDSSLTEKKKGVVVCADVFMRDYLTSLFDMGVLSSPGRCCSRAKTIQLAMMVVRIMYSNGVNS